MFRISAKATPEPNIFDIYVADVRVSKVISQLPRHEVEEIYQPRNIWKRYYEQNESLSDTDLEITSAIGHLLSGMEFS